MTSSRGRHQTLLAPQRTAARASAKVGRGLRYHVAVAIRCRSRTVSRLAGSVTIENRVSRQGVVRAKSLVRPLPLRLDAEVGSGFGEGDLDAPAAHEPGYDLCGILRRVGAKQRLRLEAMLEIADQHPPDRHDGQAAVPPDCGG